VHFSIFACVQYVRPVINSKNKLAYNKHKKQIRILKVETVSIAEPLQNRQHARKTPNAVNTQREGEREES